MIVSLVCAPTTAKSGCVSDFFFFPLHSGGGGESTIANSQRGSKFNNSLLNLYIIIVV